MLHFKIIFRWTTLIFLRNSRCIRSNCMINLHFKLFMNKNGKKMLPKGGSFLCLLHMFLGAITKTPDALIHDWYLSHIWFPYKNDWNEILQRSRFFRWITLLSLSSNKFHYCIVISRFSKGALSLFHNRVIRIYLHS